MEIAGLVFQLVECMSPSIGRRWDNHRSVYGNMETLRKRAEDLRCRKGDMESILAMQDLVEGETELRAEVKNWFECAEEIIKEVGDIEEKVGIAKLFSRAGLGKIVKLKVAEVEEIYNKGVFADSLVIQLPRRGYVKPTTSTLGGETTFKRKMEEIWECLSNNEVAKVGVYGMGGIGKTTALEHTHNSLLKDRKDDFKTVIWVTASKDSSVMSLQDKISRKLNLDLSKDDDIETRAAQLYEMLNKKMRYTLILDDLWEYYSLKEVGIPEPTSENGCKLVVTTRSLDVCRAMSCKPIAMEGLCDTEAMSLFNHVVGSYSLSFPNVAAISKEVVRECAGLPLAIVTIAGSLKDIVDINEWEIALEELREHSTTESMSSGIFEQLRFSYDRLNDKRLQDCLLYCALYPEDDIIERESLIEHLMADGMIEEKKTRQLQIKMGQVMLNKLVGACLLNEAHDSFGQKSVKMHDLVRDMALKITSGNPRYLVKARVGLRSLSDEGDWNNHVVKVSLMDNEGLWIIPSEMEPKNCVGLSTLLLQRCNLWKISNNFFLHMQKLSVLDLSRTRIENLPESISDLTTLTALFLSGCFRLKTVPSLAKLLT